uniref:Uncharacterized protein n=1 Tax=Panagrolaimus sp. PS1159 TaxID=55785 RepID=A0AC35G2C8_9BILA
MLVNIILKHPGDNGGYLLSNDTADLKFWFYVKKDLYFIPSYFIIDQGSISFQTGETIEQENFGVNFPWNRTDILNEDVTTIVTRKCVAYIAAAGTSENRQCSRFSLTSHIYDIKNNNNLVATVSSKLNVNSNSLDIDNDFTTSLNSKFALNINSYYSTNYTKGSSNLSIPLNGNRKYIFMLNFEIDDLTFISEYLGKFIKRDNYYLVEEGLAFPDQSACLSQKRLFRGSSQYQLESYMCCFA